MVSRTPLRTKEELIYPSSDGKPMADNTKQCRWVVTIFTNLRQVYRSRPTVFVAADLFWYAVEGDPTEVTAPDTMVVFGRPKGDRMSYLQWREANIAPQVVFEILSPNNSAAEIAGKFGFYNRHRVEEYYVYDPDSNLLQGWIRDKRKLKPIDEMHDWVSPRLGIKFDLSGKELRIWHANGSMFLTDEQQGEQYEQERRKREALEGELQKVRERLRKLGVEPTE